MVVSYSNGGVFVIAVWIEPARSRQTHHGLPSRPLRLSCVAAVKEMEEKLLGSYWLFLRCPPADRRSKALAFDSPLGVPISRTEFLKSSCGSSWCNARSKAMSCPGPVGYKGKSAGYLED